MPCACAAFYNARHVLNSDPYGYTEASYAAIVMNTFLAQRHALTGIISRKASRTQTKARFSLDVIFVQVVPGLESIDMGTSPSCGFCNGMVKQICDAEADIQD